MGGKFGLPRRALIVGVAIALVLGGLAWYFASPLFIRTRLVEESPFSAVMSGARTGGPPEGTSAVAPGPVTVGRIHGIGAFSDRDQVHRGSGQALLGRTAEGTAVLRFESFRVTNGPDLHVLLSRTAHPTTHDQVYDGIYVGKLKASEGAFHYELPADADLTGINSVVVYCVPFRVIFTSAPLASS